MSKFLKVLVGSAAISVAAVGVAIAVKTICDSKKEKYISSDNVEEFVTYVATPEGDESVSTNAENKE